MAQKGVQLDSERFSCSICLDLLKDPVTTSCGHNYCMKCIKAHWDGEDKKGIYSCPQCRQAFTPRPVLRKNTLLADLVEELKKSGLQAAAADHCFAGGHDTVSAAAERTKKQKQLEVSRKNIQQRIQDREKQIELLLQRLKDSKCSADKAMEDSEEMLTQMIHLLQDRIRDMKQQIRSQHETEVSEVKELKKKLKQEIRELKRKDAELEQLSLTEDHIQFLHNYPSVSALSESTHSSSIDIRPLRHFEEVTAAASQLRDQLQDIVRDTWTNISPTGTQLDVSLSDPQAEPKTRAGFLKYSRQLTLDPNTVHPQLLLSERHRKITFTHQQQCYSPHPDRFTGCYYQVLSRVSLTGRCYWEVERRGEGRVYVAVASKDISRTGRWTESGFGGNDKSWSLYCYPNNSELWYNNSQTPVSTPQSSRVGVYLDHSAGILSFYNVSETMTLIHRVQTTFPQQIHAGLGIYSVVGTSVELCELK